jgi:hypothetical protein
MDWFLFPGMHGNEVYCDAEPCSTRICTARCGKVLKRLGRKRRGFSSFSKGLATRALTYSNLLLNRGCGLEERVS